MKKATKTATEVCAFQQRVIEERLDLEEKIGKLRSFIISEKVVSIVGEREFHRLNKQLVIMTRYSDLLAERIGSFDKGA